MARKGTKGPVVWKKDEQLGIRIEKATIPRTHRRDAVIAPAHEALLVGKLQPGVLFVLLYDLEIMKFGAHITPPEFPVLNAVSKNNSQFSVGNSAIHAGAIYVDEMSHTGKRLRVLRHTFIVGCGRFIIPELNWVLPL